MRCFIGIVNFSRRLVLGGLSKAIFGYGIADYKDGTGQAEMIRNIQDNYKVFDSPVFADGSERAAFAANIEYLKTALAEVTLHSIHTCCCCLSRHHALGVGQVQRRPFGT